MGKIKRIIVSVRVYDEEDNQVFAQHIARRLTFDDPGLKETFPIEPIIIASRIFEEIRRTTLASIQGRIDEERSNGKQCSDLVE